MAEEKKPNSRHKYGCNADLLREINISKLTFCYYEDEKYANYDVIVKDLSEVTQELLEQAKDDKAKKYGLDRASLKDSDINIRLMTTEHTQDQFSGNVQKLKFPPFKHFIKNDDGTFTETLRSHWTGGFDNGYFCQTQGKVTEEYAKMIMSLVKGYAKKSNWAGYSYNDDMQGEAILHTYEVCLKFNEALSNNPFAFLTTIAHNSFLIILNKEKRQRDIRDDLLEETGYDPSYTRQSEDEMGKD